MGKKKNIRKAILTYDIELLKENVTQNNVNRVIFGNHGNITLELTPLLRVSTLNDVRNTNDFPNKTCFDDCELAKILIDNGANLNLQDRRKNTAIMRCVYNKNIELLKLLVKSGADLNLGDYENRTPLMLAAQRKEDEMVNILLRANAKKDVQTVDGLSFSKIYEKKYADIIESIDKKKISTKQKEEEIFLTLIENCKKIKDSENYTYYYSNTVKNQNPYLSSYWFFYIKKNKYNFNVHYTNVYNEAFKDIFNNSVDEDFINFIDKMVKKHLVSEIKQTEYLKQTSTKQTLTRKQLIDLYKSKDYYHNMWKDKFRELIKSSLNNNPLASDNDNIDITFIIEFLEKGEVANDEKKSPYSINSLISEVRKLGVVINNKQRGEELFWKLFNGCTVSNEGNCIVYSNKQGDWLFGYREGDNRFYYSHQRVLLTFYTIHYTEKETVVLISDMVRNHLKMVDMVAWCTSAIRLYHPMMR